MLIDGHVHVNNFFRKGRLSGMVDAYVAAGYDGIITTDHFKGKSFDEGLTLERYWAPYKELKKVKDFKVFPGAEVNILRTDFLVYGLYPEHFEGILEIDTVIGLVEYVHKLDGLVIQAHPHRSKNGKCRITVSKEVDGYELNYHPKHESNNQLTRTLVNKTKKLLTAGSDVHSGRAIGRGGMLIEGDTYADIINAIRNHEVLVQRQI